MDSQFRKRLKYARTLRDLTLEDAAKALGVSYQSWQQWETGDTVPRPSRLPKIASVLDVNQQWLAFGGADLAPVSERVGMIRSSTTNQVGDISHLPFSYRQMIRLLTQPETPERLPAEMVERTYESYQDVIEGRSAPDI